MALIVCWGPCTANKWSPASLSSSPSCALCCFFVSATAWPTTAWRKRVPTSMRMHGLPCQPTFGTCVTVFPTKTSWPNLLWSCWKPVATFQMRVRSHHHRQQQRLRELVQA